MCFGLLATKETRVAAALSAWNCLALLEARSTGQQHRVIVCCYLGFDYDLGGDEATPIPVVSSCYKRLRFCKTDSLGLFGRQALEKTIVQDIVGDVSPPEKRDQLQDNTCPPPTERETVEGPLPVETAFYPPKSGGALVSSTSGAINTTTPHVLSPDTRELVRNRPGLFFSQQQRL